MRRSSWMILATAGTLLFISCLFYLRSSTTPLKPMSHTEAVRFIERGRIAFESGDAAGVVALLAPDADFLKRSPEEVRAVLNRTFGEISEPLRVTIRNVQVRQVGRSATITFTMDVSQKLEKTNVLYFPGVQIHLKLRTVRVPRWLGLATQEEWRIVEAEGDGNLVIPGR